MFLSLPPRTHLQNKIKINIDDLNLEVTLCGGGRDRKKKESPLPREGIPDKKGVIFRKSKAFTMI